MKILITKAEFEEMGRLVSETDDPRLSKRIRALTALQIGLSVPEILEKYEISQRTLYNWVDRFMEDKHRVPVRERLEDKPRSGRPRKEEEIKDDVLKTVRDLRRRILQLARTQPERLKIIAPELFDAIKKPRKDRGDD